MQRLCRIFLVVSLLMGFYVKVCIADASPPIKIGIMYPLTGIMAMTGERMVKAAKYGFEEVGYTVAVRKIEVIVEDSAGQPAMALDKARKLVERDEVDLLIGPLIGRTQMAVAPYMTKMGVPHLAIQPAPWKATEFKWTFMAGGSNFQHPSCMGRYAYDEMGLRKITVISLDITDGHTFLNAFMGPFKKRGGQVIQEQYAPIQTVDFGPYLTVLKDADAVVAWLQGRKSIAFLSQYHEFGIRKRMPIVAAFMGSFYQPFILRNLPPDAGNAVIGEHCATQWTPFVDTEISKRFIENYKKSQGYPAEEMESSTYSGVLVALEALKKAGGNTSPENLGRAIMAIDLEVPEGRIRFDKETKCAFRDIYIAKVDKREGRHVMIPVHTYKDVPPRGFQ